MMPQNKSESIKKVEDFVNYQMLCGTTPLGILQTLIDKGMEQHLAATFVIRRLSQANKQITRGFCDVQIANDPLWNHILDDEKDLIASLCHIINGGGLAMSFQEAVNLHRFVTKTDKLSGDIAELGVYNGRSALIMAMANKSKRTMHLFDTFQGIPEITSGVDLVKVGEIAGLALDEVMKVLREYEHIRYYPGFFPQTSVDVPAGTEFSIVNLDMDVYKSTLDGLDYFYHRMVRGGIFVCHDYLSKSCPGVKKAIDEFFKDKPETIIELWHSQAVIVKM